MLKETIMQYEENEFGIFGLTKKEELIRCKDCGRYDLDRKLCLRYRYFDEMKETDFCSRPKKREEGWK